MTAPTLTVPFNDLSRQTLALRPELDAAIARVLSSGWFVLGPEHEAFESELGAYVGAHAALVGNGTDALQIALAALGVGASDTVFTAANAGGYASIAIRSLGAEPSYADVEPDTHLLSARTLEAAVRAMKAPPAAVVVTHLYGAAAPMPEIMAWAEGRGIKVLEDCAQSLGAAIDGRRVGAFGHASTTSFYPTKNLGAVGDGGAVLSRDAEVAERARRLRQYGWESKYRTTLTGGRNSRLDELQAAILRVKLRHLDAWNAQRRAIHARYEAAVAEGGEARLRLVNTASPAFVGHLAVFETGDRAGVRAALDAAGVKTDIHYPIPDHRQPVAGQQPTGDLPVTDRLCERILSVPLFAELTEGEIEAVAQAIRSASRG